MKRFLFKFQKTQNIYKQFYSYYSERIITFLKKDGENFFEEIFNLSFLKIREKIKDVEITKY